ncbi:3-oxo-5-alpha-steroid 4-dehydrogenase [Lichtheimia hyalospora FSU 10163]|nr:3-oxo-5-alpha-steroid 4-dehydrogenase [Lichtheimia hyalospora FSU 10163]
MLAECVEKIATWWRNPVVYDTALMVYTAMPPVIAPILFWIDAPYGRFAGKLIVDWNLPGKLTWFAMELLSPVAYAVSMVTMGSWYQPSSSQQLLTGIWMVHYANRAIIHPYRASSMAPINVITMLASVVFNFLNGYTNGMWNARNTFDITTPRVMLGVALWFTGLSINIYHDSVLFNLRQQRRQSNQQRYFIPQDGLFKLVSCPNYLGEMIEWSGYAMIAWPSAPAMVFALATVANLGPRAVRTHAWYKQKFTDYPRNRKALIPFLY